MADKNIFSKKNVIIGSGATLLLLIIWLLWYRNRREVFFNAILKEIRTPADTLKSGATGTVADLWSADFWDPSYLTQPNVAKATIDIATAKKINSRLSAAKGTGWLPDKEDEVIAVFQGLRNRTDIAKLADAWRITYNQPLRDFLKGFLDNTGVLFSDRKDWSIDLMNTIKKLPV